MEVDFTLPAGPITGDFDLTVTTSGNATPAISNILTFEPPPTISATSVVLGANATYRLSDASWSTLTLRSMCSC